MRLSSQLLEDEVVAGSSDVYEGFGLVALDLDESGRLSRDVSRVQSIGNPSLVARIKDQFEKFRLRSTNIQQRSWRIISCCVGTKYIGEFL